MAFDLAAALPLMKTLFNPRISKQFNTAAVYWNRFAAGKGTPISNRGMEIPTHIGPNAAFNWYSDGGNLVVGSGQSLTPATVGFFSFELSVQMTGAALDAAGASTVTYARTLAFNLQGAITDAIKYLNIYGFLDGTGILAEVGASVTLSTSVNTTVNVAGTIENAHYLRKGMTVAFMTGTTTPVKATATIVSTSNAIEDASGTQTIVVGPASAAGALVLGDGIAITGTAGAADSFSNVLSGLKLILDNGSIASTFQNINRVTTPQYNAGVIALAGSPALATDHLRRMVASPQILQGVAPSSLEFVSHPSQMHAYMDMGWPLRRFNDANSKLDIGYTRMEWEGYSWIVDTDCPKDHIFLLDRDQMFKVVARELSFSDRTGSVLLQVPGTGQYTDQFVAFLIFRGNIGTYTPNAHVKLNGLAVPVGY